MLTQWGRVTHICVSKLTIIVSDNGLSPGRRQAIIYINAGILLIGPLGTNFSEILIAIQTFSFKNALEHVVCEMASILSRSQCVKLANRETRVLLHKAVYHWCCCLWVLWTAGCNCLTILEMEVIVMVVYGRGGCSCTTGKGFCYHQLPVLYPLNHCKL